MCETCAYRPEMIHCSQCRTPLYAPDGTMRLTRNRALEELASKTFPAVERERTLNGGRCRGRGRRMDMGRRMGRGRAAAARDPEMPRLLSDSEEEETETADSEDLMEQIQLEVASIVREREEEEMPSLLTDTEEEERVIVN